MGPHAIRTTNAARQWAEVAPIVKGAGNVGILQSAPANALRVFRWVFANQHLDDPVGTAAIIVDMLAGYRHPNLYVEVWNECHPTVAQLKAVTDLLHAQGLRVAGGSYGTGDYNQPDFDVVKAAGCDAIAVHCYWGEVGFSIWNALRYREFDRHGLPILITECGRDKVEGGKGGWHLDGLSDAAYTAELVAYANETSKDDYVIGVTPFTAGATPDWQAFETDSITPQLIAALGGQPLPPDPTPTHPSPFLPGVDLSNRNGTVDVALLARCTQFAFFKASEGTTFTDSYFGPNWFAAGTSGLCRGAYHFARPSANSGHAEAQYFLGILTKNGINSGDLVALDLEDDEVSPTADLAAYTLDFLQTVESALGFRPLLYSGTPYLTAHNCIGNTALGQYGLWLADWQTTHYPAPPRGWPFVAMWQWYDHGRVPGVGIDHDVDLDYFNGTLEQLRKYGKP